MDDDFLEELDRRVSNINLDKYWERKFGDLVLWLSPIDYTQQIRVKEVLRQEANPNALEETKRVTLSGAIVGIGSEGDVMDLRPKRLAGKVIRIRGKGGKDELVDLPEFLYRKISNWDAEFIDLVFDVYADVLQSHRKTMEKDLRFENLKDPRDELQELEEKAAEIRRDLGLPPTVEAKKLDGTAPPDVEETPAEGGVPESEEPAEAVPPADGPPPPPEEPPPDPPPPASIALDPLPETELDDFDPFKTVSASSPRPQPPAPPPESPRSFVVPQPPAQVRSPIQEELARRTGAAPGAPVRPGVVGAPVRVHRAQPSVSVDVLESPADRTPVAPPRINPGPEGQSPNPRWRPGPNTAKQPRRGG